MSTSKISSSLKYSIATFLLCTSALVIGAFIYPVSLAIFNATAIPMLFVAIASISAIVALSSAIYLVKSAISTINNKNTCNILEEKPNGNDISSKTPVATTIQPSLSTLNSKEPVTNSNTSTKIPEKVPTTFGTQVPPVSVLPPPPSPNQGTSVPPPPPPLLPGQNLSISCDSSTQINRGCNLKKVEKSNVESNDSHTDLLKAIRAGVKLKKVENQDESNIESNNPRTDLLKAIKAGVKLKKIESQKSSETNTPKQENVAKILARRVYFEPSSSESEHSENEASWSDSDQDTQSSNKEEKLIEPQKSMPLEDSTITSSKIESNSAPFIPPPPPPLPTEDLKNRKPLKDDDTSKKSLGSTTPKSSSYNKQRNQARITPELLQERLKKMREKSKQPEDPAKESNMEIKDNKDNVEHKTQEEKNKVEDYDFIRSIILECIPTSIKLTDVKKGKSSGQSSGYCSDLEEDHSLQLKNTQKSPTAVMKIDSVDPVNSKVKNSSFFNFKNPFKKSKKKAEQKTPGGISRL